MQVKRILILGSGGREEVLASAYAKNKNTEKIYIAPGNGLTGFKDKKILPLPHVYSNNFDAIVAACKKYNIDLVDVAQDEPLSLGFVDKLKEKNISVFGPSKNSSELEWNKEYSRNFMKKYKIPTPEYASFSDTKKATAYIRNLKEQALFVKASGLALGKGALYAASKKEAINHLEEMKQFGKSGETFLIEECMTGEEFSFFVICDGASYVMVGAAQDHKRIYNHDQGPNTGGMGCVFPSLIVDKKITQDVEERIIKPLIDGMIKEGRAYSGILYIGGMLTNKGVKVVEFNCRWGDPEAEVILPSLKTDYLRIVEAVINGTLGKIKITNDNLTRVSVAACALGYPNDYDNVKGKAIFGLEKKVNAIIFGAGIKKQNNKYLVSGGRVVHVVGEGNDINEARRHAYSAISEIYIAENNLYYRTDIGWRDVERLIK